MLSTLIGFVIIGGAALQPLPIAYAKEVPRETLEEQIDRIAIYHSAPTTTLFNLAQSESTLGQERVGDGGDACGVVHFNKNWFPTEFTKCGDDEYILTRAAEMIASGEAWKFSPCSCIATAKNLGVKIPPKTNAWDLHPNVAWPQRGDLVLFRYPSGMAHVAVFQEWRGDSMYVKEGNFKPCKAITERLVSPNDPSLTGYWRSSQVP